MKTCFKCKQTKSLDSFYKHSKMKDGHLGKCIVCAKIDTNKRIDGLMSDPNFVESEKKRHREKARRLGYKSKNKNSTISYQKHNNKFPEKYYARNKSQYLIAPFDGAEKHHWSYNVCDALDVIWMTKKNHMKAHRFIIYDQEQMMYRRVDNNELLNTKENHLFWINWCIENKEN